MTRIRHLKPRVEPPKDRPVQWFTRSGHMFIVESGGVLLSSGVVAWCIPATLTAPSGPVHSLEPEELPVEEKPVLIRTERGVWMVGHRDGVQWWAHRNDGTADICRIDAWRPLPDDEPGDAELLEAARDYLRVFEKGLSPQSGCMFRDALRAIVEKRSGKEKP